MREPKTRRLRRFLALLLVGITAIAFTVRLFDVQVVSAGELNKESSGKRAVPVNIPAVRGDIVDRNDSVLATTNERYDVQLSPKNTKLNDSKFLRLRNGGPETEAVTAYQAFGEIGKITGQSADDIQEIVDKALKKNPKSDFAYVKKHVTLSQMNQLKELQIPWLTFASDFNRTYPSGAVAGNLLGFFSSEGKPQAGIEMSQNKCLSGTNGSETYERSADGVALPGSMVVTDEVKNGGNVHLTIDRDMQWQAQQIVNDTKSKYNAEWVYHVVMNAKTGELVAVAEDGSVDPNNVKASSADRRDARAFINPYEPGSSMKTITAAALIDQGKATPTDRMDVPDSYEEGSVRFSDWYGHGTERMTLAGILTVSSNVGTAMFGKRLSKDVRYDYLKKFGLGQETNAGMPLEDSGMLYSPEKWDPQTSYTTMFGQGLSSTIVQTAGVFQTIANGGQRVPPSLVDYCVDADGKKHKMDHGDPVNAVKKDTANQVTDILETVARNDFINSQVGIPGYRIAGKTATGEQPDGKGGYRPDWVYSFAGFFPVDDPQYVVVSSVAFPKADGGPDSAKKSWHETAQAVIRHFQVPPSKGSFTPLPTR
jgi:cell division protein FtsI (penicillin-binding protein 3)